MYVYLIVFNVCTSVTQFYEEKFLHHFLQNCEKSQGKYAIFKHNYSTVPDVYISNIGKNETTIHVEVN